MIYLLSNGRRIVADVDFIAAHHPDAVLEPPVSLPVVAAPMSVLDFRNRFTAAEKIAIYTAAKTSVAIQVWIEDLNAASSVIVTHTQTIDGVNALESAGLISVGRAAQILA